MIDNAEAVYNEWHNRLDVDAPHDEEGPWHRMAKAHLGALQGKRVLEIGCGRGGFSEFLCHIGAELVAADFSEAAVAITRRRLAELRPRDVRVADIQNIPFPDGEFDVAISLETLEHVPDPNRGLSELVRVTRPGGRLIVTTPNYFGGLGLYRFYRNLTGRPFTEMDQPINHPLTLKERIRRLKALGCHIDVVDGCGHYFYIPGRDPIRAGWLDQPRFLMKWLAAHSLTVATKRLI